MLSLSPFSWDPPVSGFFVLLEGFKCTLESQMFCDWRSNSVFQSVTASKFSPQASLHLWLTHTQTNTRLYTHISRKALGNSLSCGIWALKCPQTDIMNWFQAENDLLSFRQTILKVNTNLHNSKAKNHKKWFKTMFHEKPRLKKKNKPKRDQDYRQAKTKLGLD